MARPQLRMSHKTVSTRITRLGTLRPKASIYIHNLTATPVLDAALIVLLRPEGAVDVRLVMSERLMVLEQNLVEAAVLRSRSAVIVDMISSSMLRWKNRFLISINLR